MDVLSWVLYLKTHRTCTWTELIAFLEQLLIKWRILLTHVDESTLGRVYIKASICKYLEWELVGGDEFLQCSSDEEFDAHQVANLFIQSTRKSAEPKPQTKKKTVIGQKRTGISNVKLSYIFKSKVFSHCVIVMFFSIYFEEILNGTDWTDPLGVESEFNRSWTKFLRIFILLCSSYLLFVNCASTSLTLTPMIWH